MRPWLSAWNQAAILAEPVEIGAAADVAAEVGEEKAVGLFFFGDGVVLLPELEEAIIEDAPIGGSAGGRQLAADGAVALGQAADAAAIRWCRSNRHRRAS